MRQVLFGLLAVGLGGCIYDPIGEPMYAEVVPGVLAGTVTIDDDGVLHALYWAQEDGLLRYGSMDLGGSWRFEDHGPLSLDGEVIGGQRFFVDIAARPGTDEVWAWVGGVVGPIQGGNDLVSKLILESPQNEDYRGALVFEGEDTLHTSLAGLGAWFVYTMDGDEVVGEPEIIGEPVVWGDAPCDFDIADGFVHGRTCVDNSGMSQGFSMDLATRLPAEFPDWPTDELSATPFQQTGTIAVAEGYGWMQRPEFLPACVVEARDGFLFRDDSRVKNQDDLCDPYDYYGPVPTYADIAPGGERVVMAFREGPLVVMSEDRPKDFERDKVGRWCPTVGFEGGDLVLNEDGTMIWPGGGGSELLYTEITWTQGRDTITVDLHNPDDSLTQGDERFEMYAKRVGDSLHIRNATHERDEDHFVASGFTGFPGIYTKCD